MNSENPSTVCKQPSKRFLSALMLTVALLLTALLNLTSCSTQKQTIKTRSISHRQQFLKGSDTASLVQHVNVYDTLHIITNETIWRKPDTLGRLYPLKTITKESGATRQTNTETVYQTKDTIYISTSDNTTTSTDTQIRAPTNTWLPWLIIACMVIIAIIILAIRIILIR